MGYLGTHPAQKIHVGYTWGPTEGFLYHDFGAMYVLQWKLGPFGLRTWSIKGLPSLRQGPREPTASSFTNISLNHALGLQIYKYYLLWALKYIDMTYFGLFGAPRDGLGIPISFKAYALANEGVMG